MHRQAGFSRQFQYMHVRSPVQFAQQLQAAIHGRVPPSLPLPCRCVRCRTVGGARLLALRLIRGALLLASRRRLLLCPSCLLLLTHCCRCCRCSCCCWLLLCLLQALGILQVLWLRSKPCNLLTNVCLQASSVGARGRSKGARK